MNGSTILRHDRGGVSATRRPRLRAAVALLAALHLFSACYTYVPARPSPAPGAALALELTDTGRVVHSAALGPGILRVTGALKGMDGDKYVVDVSAVKPIRGQELPVTGITVSLAPGDVTDVRERTFSRKRTAAVIGTAMAVIVTFLATKGFKSGQTPPEGPPGDGGPDQ